MGHKAVQMEIHGVIPVTGQSSDKVELRADIRVHLGSILEKHLGSSLIAQLVYVLFDLNQPPGIIALS